MTNFEKWKQDLTISEANAIFIFGGCGLCPAKNVCDGSLPALSCERAFQKWTNTRADILPCPFCGAEAEVDELKNAFGNTVFSNKCSMSGCILRRHNTYFPTQEEADKTWNKRI